EIIKIFCITHNASLTTTRPNSVVMCNEGSDSHTLGENFPNSGKWFYCCDCQHYWAVVGDMSDFVRQCPACGSSEHPRYYSCDQCKTTMVDFSGAYYQKDFRIMPWGQPHPYCPGCSNPPRVIPQTHRCPVLRALLTTARAECIFCEVDKPTGSDYEISS